MNSGLSMPTLRESRCDDWPAVRQLLQEAQLPVEDLGPAALDGFLIAESGNNIVGLVGLQIFDTKGLLRSLVVARSARSGGLGGRLVGALEAAAQTAGIEELWLLTIDAEQFFLRHGFEFVSRDEAPDCIQQTEEFRDLCPDDAHLMRKSVR